jgi:large subunit ribosomal protein L25
MGDLTLTVDLRSVTGKKVKALRRQGVLPLHVYGRNTESLALQAPKQAVLTLLRQASPNTIIDLHVNGEPEARPVVIREVQRNPVTGDLLHVDLLQISLTEKLRTEVPIHVVGEAPAVHALGGILLQNVDRVPVEGLPTEIPQYIEVDVSGLEALDSSIHVRDLQVPAGITVLADPDQVVIQITAPRLAAAEEEEAEEVEAAAAEEAAEEAAPAEEQPAEEADEEES